MPAIPTPAAEELLSRAREILPGLSPTERRLLATVLDDPDAVPDLSITELAGRADCSEATVVRLCQRLGLRGYGQLRLALSRRSVSAIALARGAIRPDEADRDVLVKTLTQAAQLLETIAHGASAELEAAFSRAADTLVRASTVLVLGIGASSAIAQDAAHQLRTIGLHAVAPADPFAQLFEAGRLSAGDVCLLISHTGSTVEMLRCAQAAGTTSATRIGISSYRTTPLEAETDVLLVAGGTTPTFRPEASTNRLAHLLLVDALVNATTLRAPERASAAVAYLQSVASTNQI